MHDQPRLGCKIIHFFQTSNSFNFSLISNHDLARQYNMCTVFVVYGALFNGPHVPYHIFLI